MTLANTRHLPKEFSLRDAFSRIMRAIQDKTARRAEYLRVLGELELMTDRDLDDIGICRHMIRDIAHTAAYGQ